MARTSSAKGWSPSYKLRAVRKRMVNFIALGSYNSLIKHQWMIGGEHWDWALKGMWTDELITDDDETECLLAARDWEEEHNGTS